MSDNVPSLIMSDNVPSLIMPPVSLIPVVHLDLQISPRIVEKILHDPNFIFRGLGGR
jgi:hypothetical protein